MIGTVRVGIDPGSRQCVAVGVDGDGQTRHRRSLRFAPDRPGVERFLQRVDRQFAGAKRHFVVEASGIFWFAPAALLKEHGESVSLISPSYTKAQRKVSSKHAKSDATDAEALARCTFTMGEKATHPADIPEGERLNLQMLCRHRKTLQNDATGIKLRIFAWLGLTTPGLTALIGTDLSQMDRDFIRRYPVVAKITRLGKKRLLDFLQSRSPKTVDPALVDDLFELAQTAYSPRDFDDKLFAEQIDMELKRVELIEKQIKALDKRIAPLVQACDPDGLARSIPGFGEVVAPIMVAEAGTDVTRFANPSRFAGWTGLVAKAHGSSARQADGLSITKAGRANVKCALFMAANIARQIDPDLGDLYQRLRDKGKHHNLAVNAVAHKLARIYWAVMTYRKPYQIPCQKPLDTH